MAEKQYLQALGATERIMPSIFGIRVILDWHRTPLVYNLEPRSGLD